MSKKKKPATKKWVRKQIAKAINRIPSGPPGPMGVGGPQGPMGNPGKDATKRRGWRRG